MQVAISLHILWNKSLAKFGGKNMYFKPSKMGPNAKCKETFEIATTPSAWPHSKGPLKRYKLSTGINLCIDIPVV